MTILPPALYSVKLINLTGTLRWSPNRLPEMPKTAEKTACRDLNSQYLYKSKRNHGQYHINILISRQNQKKSIFLPLWITKIWKFHVCWRYSWKLVQTALLSDVCRSSKIVLLSEIRLVSHWKVALLQLYWKYICGTPELGDFVTCKDKQELLSFRQG